MPKLGVELTNISATNLGCLRGLRRRRKMAVRRTATPSCERKKETGRSIGLSFRNTPFEVTELPNLSQLKGILKTVKLNGKLAVAKVSFAVELNGKPAAAAVKFVVFMALGAWNRA